MATDYTETRILVAAMDGDEEEGKRLIAELSPKECARVQFAMLRADVWIEEVEDIEEKEKVR
jgi:hypothetical protein